MSTTLLQTPQTTAATKSFSQAALLDFTDECLMAQVQAGDPQALGQLHDRYASMVKALVMKILLDEAESDDMVQDIFLEVWERAGSYDPATGKALGWIITLARRFAIDRVRQKGAYGIAVDRFAEQSQQELVTMAARSEEDSVSTETRKHLQHVFATLPAAQRKVIELAFYKGMSQREIAAHTGQPLGTIKIRLELGLKNVAKAVKGFEELL